MSDRPLDLAHQHHQSGRLSEAQAAYRQALAGDPANPAILQLLGIVTCQLGDLEAGVDFLRRAVAAAPQVAEYHYNLGSALSKLRHFDSAIASYRRALELNPSYPEAYASLSDALREQEQFEESVAMSRRALALRPDYAPAHHSLGRAFRGLGDLENAAACFARAVELQPRFFEACINWGGALFALRRMTEAIAAYRSALALRPDDPRGTIPLGNALVLTGEADEALTILRRAVALEPRDAAAHNSLGNALQSVGHLRQAIEAFGRAIEIEPANAMTHSNLIYALQFDPDCDARAMLGKQLNWNDRHARPLRLAIRNHPNDPNPRRRLRIGYVSPDFCAHVVGRNILPLLRLHDRTQFEVFCYSNCPRPDALTEQFRAYADGWRDIRGIGDEQAAEIIRQDRIDILIDLALHMRDNRLLLFARKPAPVQVTFGGYPGGTGLEAIDYRLTDPYLDPPGQNDEFYCEKSIRLPNSFWCYDAAAMELADSPPVNALPALSERKITFGCLNNFVKTNDHTLRLWSDCLSAIPESRIIVRSPRGEHRRGVVEKLRVDPSRVEFVGIQSRFKYLQTYGRIDLGLDTFPYNGHTTSLDGLWMGVPVISLSGQTAVSCAGLSQSTNLGLAEQLVAKNPREFVRLAVELARDLPRLAQMRSTLRQRMEKSHLMDARQFAIDVESAFRRMWEQWCDCQAKAAAPGSAGFGVASQDDAVATADHSELAQAEPPLDLAKQHHQAGRLTEAQAAYRQALAHDPGNGAILQLLGIVTCQLGDLNAGVGFLRRAAAAGPLVADYQCNLGSALSKLKQFDSAVASYRRALELNPNYPEAYSGFSDALNGMGQFEEAVGMSRRALALRPNYAAAHHNLGWALRSLGNLDEATACFERAVDLQPRFVEAMVNLAAMQAITGQTDAAIETFRKAIALRENSFEAWNGLAATLVRTGRWNEAATAAGHALEIRPEDPGAAATLAFSLLGRGQIDSALALWRRVSIDHPESAEVQNGLGNALQAAGDMSGAVAEYSRAAALDPSGTEFYNNYLYGLYFLPDYPQERVIGEHRQWNDRYSRPLFNATPYAITRDSNRRLKIGYVSPDFRNHCQSFFTLPLLRNHNHEQFEIYLYPSVVRPDQITQQIRNHADAWRDVVGRSDEQVAQRIRDDRIDILVDLTMHMAHGRPMLFARKPAPIQIAWLAYPGTTGLTAMDYRLTDPQLDPPGEHDQWYSEKSIRLPDTFWCYDPAAPQLQVTPLPALQNGHITFGCMNNFCKRTDQTLSHWSTILKSVAGSRLILLCPPGEHRQRVLDKLNIEPHRVEFVQFQPRDVYLRTYQRIDLCIDTFPYNGHTTSLDSLWMGVPVISLSGESAVSRAGLSQSTNLGLARQLVARTGEEFGRLAVELAGDLPRLAKMRSNLRERMEKSPLMDAKRFAANVESVYRQVWGDWCGR